MIRSARSDSPLGPLTLAARDGALLGLWMEGQKYFGAGLLIPGEVSMAAWDECEALARARAWLERYFAGEKPSPSELDLAPQGTPFQRAVWSLLCELPYGQLTSYGELARRLGASPRAVGSAVGRNPISIIIPCHRVISASGELTGYAGGLERKRWLLEHEGAIIDAASPRK